ncbi:hypothetical protein CPB86DRAFT_873688 [Serendipita vermifera]|nr:hypothetical protein CPB86DRAFT_873688 [Serendipita vermifera]
MDMSQKVIRNLFLFVLAPYYTMSDNKRKHPGNQSGSRKRYKADGSRITSTTIHGPGVFITCVKGKERQAGREIRDVFESIAEKLWPSAHATTEDGSQAVDTKPLEDEEDEEEDEDIESLISKQRVTIQTDDTLGEAKKGSRADGKTDQSKPKKRIVIHYTDTPCILFAACLEPIDPVQLTIAYLDEVKASGVARTRTVQRLEPISNTSVAALPELLLLAEKIVAKGFTSKEQEDHKPTSYKIIAKVRNNSKLSSQKIIEELPKKVPLGNPVSLKTPELVILVIVFKSVAGIGVIPRYEELKRYNVTQLVEARDLDAKEGADSRLKLAKSNAGTIAAAVEKEEN